MVNIEELEKSVYTNNYVSIAIWLILESKTIFQVFEVTVKLTKFYCVLKTGKTQAWVTPHTSLWTY